MRILLDECLPRKLKQMFSAHDAVTVREMGWTGTKNGALLRLAENEFDLFITADRNLSFQQNLQSTALRIVVLVAPNNRLDTLQNLIPQVLDLLPRIKAGEIIYVRAMRDN
jgi:predicted nuclease of predicted toxin-antitoxin system